MSLLSRLESLKFKSETINCLLFFLKKDSQLEILFENSGKKFGSKIGGECTFSIEIFNQK